MLTKTTHAFRNGNSQAVRIPADLAYEREGEEIRIRPARRALSDVLAKLARFSPDCMAEGRGGARRTERDGL
jgi:antitoxin VapB